MDTVHNICCKSLTESFVDHISFIGETTCKLAVSVFLGAISYFRVESEFGLPSSSKLLILTYPKDQVQLMIAQDDVVDGLSLGTFTNFPGDLRGSLFSKKNSFSHGGTSTLVADSVYIICN